MEGLTDEEARAHNALTLNGYWENLPTVLARSGDGERTRMRVFKMLQDASNDEKLSCLGVPKEVCNVITNLVDPNSSQGKLPRPFRVPGPFPITLDDAGGSQDEYDFLCKLWNGDALYFVEKCNDVAFKIFAKASVEDPRNMTI